MARRPGTKAPGTKFSAGCAALFSLPFAGMGTLFFFFAVREAVSSGRWGLGIGMGLFSSVFMLIGYGMLLAALSEMFGWNLFPGKPLAPKDGDGMAWFPKLEPGGRGPRGGVLLRPENTAVGAAVGLGFFALFWNGISWFALYQVAFREDHVGKVAAVFISLFCLVGLAIAAGWIHQVLRVFLTSATLLEISREPARPGEALRWTLWHRADYEINRATLRLVCRERATYRVGTDTTRVEHAVLDRPLFERMAFAASKEVPIAEGVLELPADAVHSFHARNNEIFWSLDAMIDIPNRPDATDKFVFRVEPPAGPRP